MKRIILHNPAFCAVTEGEKLAEYIPMDASDQSGDILLGKVDRLMPGINGAFVDVGRARNGFLPLTEDSGSFLGPRLRSGDLLVVQIRKEEKGNKGVFLTRDIILPGRYVLVMPMNRHIGVSSRIADEEVRERLKKTGRNISGDRFGIVLRNAAENTAESEIMNEADELFREWQELIKTAEKGVQPGAVLRHGSILEQLKADYFAYGIDGTLEVDHLDTGLARQLKQAAERTVSLPGGGNIVIDRCEAMTVIDVNTASSTGCCDKPRTILETNLEACEAIADQIRLRNLSGIIVIDFIDPATETDQSLVTERLSTCLRADRIKTVIHGWTSLGLMEITRKRTRPSLYDEFYRPCEACGGLGYILGKK